MLDDEPDSRPSTLSAYRSPEVLGLAGFALAVSALLGFGLLSGNILLSVFDGQPSEGRQIAAALLGAALGGVPLLMGLDATRHLLDDDPLWVSAVARAAVLLGAVVIVLRLAHTAAALLGDNPGYAVY